MAAVIIIIREIYFMSLNTALKKKRGSYGAHAVGPAWQYLPTQNFVSTDAQYC